ncbi:hypothetical protein HHK36_014293 [Tetracentron sinense]|uniref:GATA-type domain-containing protein n=1 Tax=Tetracentron sinense TaxID=13715 RepID=A0A834Z7V6_TETSI|nr:hypothetical protein HHK36_014293 [Tetracentron sinense]
MTPICLNPSPSPFPLVVLNEDQNLQLFNPSPQASCSSSYSYLTSPIYFNSTDQDQGGSYCREPQLQQEADRYVSHGGSSDHQLLPSPSLPTVENDSNPHGLKLSICRNEIQNDNGSVKWMSSKMRLMRKMVNSDPISMDKPVRSTQKFQDQQQSSSPSDTENRSNNSSNNSNTTIRVCTHCNTTKTPLWRSGPGGPKSLCNACGIRQRKARRAMAAAAASENGTILATDTSSMRTKVHHKEKRSENSYIARYKKRSPPHSRKKLCFEDFTINLSKNLAFHQVFPSDEKEAAILLMALSCGLLRS